MKSAKQWTEEFCNEHIINVRGSKFEEFIKQVQKDAIEYIDNDNNQTVIKNS